jgi:L-arabinokinase
VTLVFYISGHGFGHAARQIEIINALRQLDASVRIVVRSSVPRWFLDASLDAPIDLITGDVDSGVVQPDSLSIDEDATTHRAALFYRGFDQCVRDESTRLRTLRTTLVIGDAPPLAFAAADTAGVPSIAVANFTWDWIYEGFPRFDVGAPGVRHLISTAYSQATRALRLPFAGGFGSMPLVDDVPLVARHASVPRSEVRRRLGLESDRPVVLGSFGGHGGGVPMERAARPSRFTLVATEYEADTRAASADGLKIIATSELAHAGLTYADLVGAVDVVVAKLGYGIVSECIANGVALLYTFRGRFVEQEVFARELPGVLRCRPIAPKQLLEGAWADDIDALLAQPSPRTTMASNGAAVVAAAIVEAGCSARGA